MIVTKHCKPADRARMLRGHFKIGSHKEYSDGETSGFLSDTAEGYGATAVTGDMHIDSMAIGESTLSGFSILGAKRAIAIDTSSNSLIFCSARGKYDQARHLRIRDGDPAVGYRANHNATSYLTLDVDRLQTALTAATDYFFQATTRWICKPVHYKRREKIVSAKRFKGISSAEIQRRASEAAFTKPVNFQPEEEFRFMMVPYQLMTIPRDLMTMTLPWEIQCRFIAAIVDKGTD